MKQVVAWGLIFSCIACAKAPPRIPVEKLTPPTAVRGEAAVELIVRGEKKQLQIVFALMKPDRLRIEVIDAALGSVAIAAADGEKMWLWLPQQHKKYVRRARSKYVEELIGLRWEIAQLLELLSGHRPIPESRRAFIEFGRHRLIDGITFPMLIKVAVPEKQLALTVKYTDIALGGMIDEHLFQPTVH